MSLHVGENSIETEKANFLWALWKFCWLACSLFHILLSPHDWEERDDENRADLPVVDGVVVVVGDCGESDAVEGGHRFYFPLGEGRKGDLISSFFK